MDTRIVIAGITIVVIIIAFFLIQPAEPTLDPQPPGSAPDPRPQQGVDQDCGDGVCLPREEAMGSCPQDCEEPEPEPQPGTDPDCGDGTCQPREEALGSCPEDCGTQPGPPDNQPPATTNGLTLVKELTLGSGTTRRPLVAITDDRVFIIYGKENRGTWDFILEIYDKSLENMLVTKTIVSASEYGTPMDVRIGTQGDYLYLFHDAAQGQIHSLIGYKFTLDDEFEKVASLDTPLAAGIGVDDAEPGAEVVDDPIVLPTADKLYVITRYKGVIDTSADTKYKVYELTHNLEKLNEFDLDLSSVSDGGARQASIKYYNGYYYMATSTLTTNDVTGSQAAVTILSPTDVVIVKLDTNWNIVDSKTIPGDIEDDAESYLTAFDLDDNYYYLSYKHATFESGTSFDGPLMVYDKAYNLVASVIHQGNPRPQLVLADGLIYYALGTQGAQRSRDDAPETEPVPSKLYVYGLDV